MDLENKLKVIKNIINVLCQDVFQIMNNKYLIVKMGEVDNDYNIRNLGGRDGQVIWGKEFESRLAKMVKENIY